MHSSSNGTINGAHTGWKAFLNAFLGATMKPLWPTNTKTESVETDQIDPATGRNLDQIQESLVIVGTSAGAALPQRACVVVGLRTTLPTRAGRGRFYCPAPSVAALQANGELTNAAASTIAAGAASALSAEMPVTAFGIFHRATGFITPVSSITVSTVLGTQRRRTNKVAPNYQSANL